ncbi:MAG: NAD(P)/FAD-dependent oxidoreductase [Gemmatimonadales bacterium]|jgi:phytoene dehydrogenase-like protein
MSDAQAPVVIVGAGLAGLAAARTLVQASIPCTVLETSDRVGGRVTTEMVEGFLLDRGFQVYITSYPEGGRFLRHEALELGAFVAGSLVWAGGKLHHVADPSRHPAHGVRALFAPVVSITDIARLDRIRKNALKRLASYTPPRQLTETGLDYLRRRNVSDRAIERFFRPFFGGVLLDREVGVPHEYFEFLFGAFAAGRAALPAHGMQAIPDQLAARLPKGVVRLETTVMAIEAGGVALASGERVAASAVIIATDAEAAHRWCPALPVVEWNGCTTLYFAADRPPVSDPILVLNGSGPEDGPVNHLAVPSNAQPGYAPEDKALIAATILGDPPDPDEQLKRAVRRQLMRWFGSDPAGWKHLATYRVPNALPRFDPALNPGTVTMFEIGGMPVYPCGDYVEDASINGALRSGRRVAGAVISARRAQRPVRDVTQQGPDTA